MTSYEKYLSDKTAIPPEPKEREYGEVKVICTVITSLEVPKDLENYIDIKEWIESNYNLFNNHSQKYIFDDVNEVYIDDIEK